MTADDIRVGSTVRYPRTGTSGTVVKIEEIDGSLFAEVDSTHLMYRLDELIPIENLKIKGPRKKTDDLDTFMSQKIVTSEDIREAYEEVDGVGAG